jgi:hypothetical protein
MKTTRIIAGAALASLLVIGPLTMTRAHDFPWPGPFSGDLMAASQIASGTGSGSLLQVDLRAEGMSADALSEAIETSTLDNGLEVRRLQGVYHTFAVSAPGSSQSALIQIDSGMRLRLIGQLFDDGHGNVIICVLGRPTPVVVPAGMDDGIDPQQGKDAATAAGLLLTAGMTF